MTDDEFLIAFEQCSLPEDQWTHRAHLRMAWLRLHRASLQEAMNVVRDGIQRYNSSLEKTLAYHETITQAFLRLIHHRMKGGASGETFDSFCKRNVDLVDSGTNVLLTHYRKEALFSAAARQEFVEPDLLPLP